MKFMFYSSCIGIYHSLENVDYHMLLYLDIKFPVEKKPQKPKKQTYFLTLE